MVGFFPCGGGGSEEGESRASLWVFVLVWEIVCIGEGGECSIYSGICGISVEEV